MVLESGSLATGTCERGGVCQGGKGVGLQNLHTVAQLPPLAFLGACYEPNAHGSFWIQSHVHESGRCLLESF